MISLRNRSLTVRRRHRNAFVSPLLMILLLKTISPPSVRRWAVSYAASLTFSLHNRRRRRRRRRRSFLPLILPIWVRILHRRLKRFREFAMISQRLAVAWGTASRCSLLMAIRLLDRFPGLPLTCCRFGNVLPIMKKTTNWKTRLLMIHRESRMRF